MISEMQRRVNAVMATEARFRDRAFDWSKAATCIHLVRFHAAQLGHSLPVVPQFRTALSARRALQAAGFASLPELLDGQFERIPPAFMRVGDIVAMPGDDAFDALSLKADKLKYLGWHEDAPGCQYMEVDISAAIGAWRL